ncbi:MAG: hypothetical protein AAB337_01050 [Patescibacteria group bacterium]
MFDIRPLISSSFWFDRDPSPLLAGSSRLLFALFAILFTFGVIVRVVATRRTEDRFTLGLFRRIGQLCVTMGIAGLVFFFFTYQQIPFLGMRLWFLLLGAGFLVWLGFIVRWVKKIVPAERANMAERAIREKYLPKPKK